MSLQTCPCCGGHKFSVLREVGGTRKLVCRTCEAVVLKQPVLCPACGKPCYISEIHGKEIIFIHSKSVDNVTDELIIKACSVSVADQASFRTAATMGVRR